eukprot:Gb_27620 [translate_table: standard]
MLKKVERKIIFWQEGKKHEIIYPSILQLIINHVVDKEKKKKQKLKDKYKLSKILCKELRAQLEAQELEFEKCIAKFSTTLEEKRIEIALLCIEETLKEYGLTSLLLDTVRRKEDPSGQIENKNIEIEDLKNQLEGYQKSFEQRVACKDAKIQKFQCEVTILEDELKAERQKRKDIIQIFDQTEFKFQGLELKLKEKEDNLGRLEKEFEKKIGSTLEAVNLVERKLISEVPVKKNPETRLQEAQRLIKILREHLKIEKEQSSKSQ